MDTRPAIALHYTHEQLGIKREKETSLTHDQAVKFRELADLDVAYVLRVRRRIAQLRLDDARNVLRVTRAAEHTAAYALAGVLTVIRLNVANTGHVVPPHR